MKKCKYHSVLFILCTGLVLLLANSSVTCTKVAPPAEFKITSLNIEPPKVQIGETVNISILVENIGDAEGAYPATLLINDIKEQIKVTNVAPGESKAVTFSTSKGKAGTYKVKVGDLTGTIIVTPSPVPIYSNPQTYRMVRTLTIKNETARVNSLRIWMPAVTDWDSQRNVVSENTSLPPSSVWKDPQFGTGILFWQFTDKPSGGSSLVITDQLTYTCYEINYQIDPGQIPAYDKTDAQYILYTRSEKYLEADDPNIVKTAKEIMGNKTSPYDIAQSFYNWVMAHMTYQKVGGLKGAKFAFENGYGECGDYSALFVALCRASGIPARPVVGRCLRPDDWHVWVEFYLPGYGWIPVDPTFGDSGYGNYFGHIDNKRLIFNKQYNIVLYPNPYFFPSEQSGLQTWFWEYQGFQGTISADIHYSITPIPGS